MPRNAHIASTTSDMNERNQIVTSILSEAWNFLSNLAFKPMPLFQGRRMIPDFLEFAALATILGLATVGLLLSGFGLVW